MVARGVGRRPVALTSLLGMLARCGTTAEVPAPDQHSRIWQTPDGTSYTPGTWGRREALCPGRTLSHLARAGVGRRGIGGVLPARGARRSFVSRLPCDEGSQRIGVRDDCGDPSGHDGNAAHLMSRVLSHAPELRVSFDAFSGGDDRVS